jgi:hypothetical protein
MGMVPDLFVGAVENGVKCRASFKNPIFSLYPPFFLLFPMGIWFLKSPTDNENVPPPLLPHFSSLFLHNPLKGICPGIPMSSSAPFPLFMCAHPLGTALVKCQPKNFYRAPSVRPIRKREIPYFSNSLLNLKITVEWPTDHSRINYLVTDDKFSFEKSKFWHELISPPSLLFYY